MNNVSITVWGRVFELNVVFDCYSGEEVLPYQKAALDAFLGDNTALEVAKASVETFCLSQDGEKIGASNIDNIFKYVIPESIYVQRNKAEKHIVALMCDYKFDIEHGLAVIFEDEKFREIGSQDVVL